MANSTDFIKSFYGFKSYKHLVQAWVESHPKGGRGLYRQIAMALNVSTVLISQIFNGTRDLTLEQALALADFLGLDEKRTEFFVLLVSEARAGTDKLRNHYQQKLARHRKSHEKIKNRVTRYEKLSASANTEFFSDWVYSAVHLLSAIKGHEDPRKLAQRLEISPKTAQKVLEFLLAEGLSVRQGNEIKMGIASTHIEPGSPTANQYHRGWRLKGLHRMSNRRDGDLFFTSSVSLNRNDFDLIRRELLEVIERFSKKVDESTPNTVACLHLDWYEL